VCGCLNKGYSQWLQRREEARGERRIQTGEQARDGGVDGSKKPVQPKLGDELVEGVVDVLRIDL
jgi:hypothetical protein